MNIIDVLRERGFIENTTHEQELYDYVNEPITCYIGFDPTASSLHIGSLVPIMSLAHMQRMGHRPIALVGGGTGLVGDPSGKTEMRKMLTVETIEANVLGIKKQLSRFINFENDRALMANNADWLTKLEYIPLLRDIGRHFSVNRMIKAESYKMRLDSDEGLSFIEFNYMILQAYDFMELAASYGCRLQMGGSDQWGNIVAGIELIRKTQQQTAFGITFPLITTSSGAKMGKTAKGAVWLDPNLTSPYEYYQYWINTDDRDVERFMALFTFLPMDEVRIIQQLEGAELNAAKMVLAFEATVLAHGQDEALKAYRAAADVFGGRQLPQSFFPSSSIPRGDAAAEDDSIPCTFMEAGLLEVGMPAYELFFAAKLAKSKGEARRLINQGGGYLNGNRLESHDYLVTSEHFEGGEILIRAGKKRYHKIKFQH
jgi:tyrosyl-tRNA synthetase